MTKYVLINELPDVLQKVAGTVFEQAITPNDFGVWIRIDTADSDSKDQWDNYLDLVEQLRTFGYDIHDPLVEHDCISGDLCYTEENVKSEQETKSPVVDSLYTRVFNQELAKSRQAGKSAVDLIDVDSRVLKLTRAPIQQLLDYIENSNTKE